jgi:hypothetical protein
MTEILPRSADVLWELAKDKKDKKRIKDTGRDQMNTGVTNNQVPLNLINSPALEIF